MRNFAIVIITTSLLATAVQAQTIDPGTSSAVLTGGGGHLLNCPAGDGAEIRSTSAGSILVTVVDTSGNPVTGLDGSDFEVDGQTPFSVADCYFPSIPRWDHFQDYVSEPQPGTYVLVGAILAGATSPPEASSRCGACRCWRSRRSR